MASINMDPLRLLQTTLTAKATIHLLPSDDPSSTPVSSLSECTHLSFPDPSDPSKRIILPKTTPTRFKRTPQSTASETWDLQALLLAFLRKDNSIAEYAQEAVQQSVELVGVMQRKIVADFLEGKDATLSQSAPYLVPEGEPTNIDTSVEASLSSGQVSTAAGQAATSSATAASASQGGGATATTTQTTTDGRPAKKARYVVNKEDLEIYKKIVACWEPRQIADRNTVLRGNFKINNFGNVRDLIQDRLKSGKEELRRSTTSSKYPPAAVQPVPQPQRRRRQANPIIIVSPSSSALITMYNVKRFLEESVYEPSDIARAESGRIAEDVVQINHKRAIGSIGGESSKSHEGGLSGVNRAERTAAGEKLVRYFVVDGVDALSKFGDDAWDRVVCVVTTGQEWQFRPYKWTEPKELFHHVKGIHFKLTNDPPNPKIANWNVTELKIDPNKRYIDKSTVSDFWRILEAWTAQHKTGIVDF